VGATTGIQWTDATWNPWMGCRKVSPACAHCYMFSEQRRYGHDPDVVRRSKTTFDAPLRWPVEQKRVFTCSWSDWFIEDADEWRPEAWEVIRHTPHLTYQILTKRPELIADRLPGDWGRGWPNVWLGVSVENRRFVWRAEWLAAIPAVVHFLSCEPLLGPLDLSSSVLDSSGPHMEWVIAGGESGARARATDLAWLRSLRDQCQGVHVPYFVKQIGVVAAGGRGKGGDMEAWPEDLRVREMPERAA